MVEPRDEFIMLPFLNMKDSTDRRWGYVHVMSIVAVTSAFLNNESKACCLHLASGAELYVLGPAEKIMKVMRGEEQW
jgi:hypothetical protein